jgi:two-component system, chemotaxis family, sensor kinase Cph1
MTVPKISDPPEAVSRTEPPLVDTDFLHAMLHDLRGPVSRVRMLSELIERRAVNLDPESQLLLGHMKTSATAAEDVLDAVRRYTGALHWPCRPSRFDLNLALNSALARHESRLAAVGARVARGDLPAVVADMVQMGALFEELIANAVRFRSEEPLVIEVVAAATQESCLISVMDNGIGVSESAAERIFKPLAKASDRSGAGVGLAICRRVAELHNGEIVAIPRAQGSEFRLRIPQ